MQFWFAGSGNRSDRPSKNQRSVSRSEETQNARISKTMTTSSSLSSAPFRTRLANYIECKRDSNSGCNFLRSINTLTINDAEISLVFFSFVQTRIRIHFQVKISRLFRLLSQWSASGLSEYGITIFENIAEEKSSKRFYCANCASEN